MIGDWLHTFTAVEWLKLALGAVDVFKLALIPLVILGWNGFVKKIKSSIRSIVCTENEAQMLVFNDRYIKKALFLERCGQVDNLFAGVKGQIEQLSLDNQRRQHDMAGNVAMIAKHLDFIDELAEQSKRT